MQSSSKTYPLFHTYYNIQEGEINTFVIFIFSFCEEHLVKNNYYLNIKLTWLLVLLEAHEKMGGLIIEMVYWHDKSFSHILMVRELDFSNLKSILEFFTVAV